MKYFLHDSTSINQELIVKLFSNFGFEGYGIYYSILERIAFMESPIDKNLAIFTLRLTKKHQKILDFCIEIGLLLQEKNEIFEENILENAKKYIIRKDKTKEKVKKFRENIRKNSNDTQLLNQNVTSYDTVTKPLCNQNVTTVKESKVNKSKVIKTYSFEVESLIEYSKQFFDIKYLNGESHETFDKLIRLDNYSIDKIKTAISNGKKDNFWQNQFLSPAKLRSKNKDNILYIDLFLNLKAKQPQQTDIFKVTTESMTDIKNNPNRLKFK